MSIVNPNKQNLAGKGGRECRVIPVDTMRLLQGETKFLGIQGEGGARIEVFLETAEYGVQSSCAVVVDACDLPSLAARIRHAYDFGSVEGNPCSPILCIGRSVSCVLSAIGIYMRTRCREAEVIMIPGYGSKWGQEGTNRGRPERTKW